MINLAKAAVATLAATTAVGLVLTAAPATAHATPTTAHKASASTIKHAFGQTVTVDGFRLKATMKPAAKDHHRFTEEINMYITPTKHHKKWQPVDHSVIRYGKHLQRTPLEVNGQGFGYGAKPPYMDGGVFAFGKKHLPKHVQYTFKIMGQQVVWTND